MTEDICTIQCKRTRGLYYALHYALPQLNDATICIEILFSHEKICKTCECEKQYYKAINCYTVIKMGNLFSLYHRVFAPDSSKDMMTPTEDTWLEIEKVSNENHSRNVTRRKRSKNANKYTGEHNKALEHVQNSRNKTC